MLEIEAFFAAAGPLARSVAGYEERPQQARMAREVMESLHGGRHLLVEAGTGVGKSLAYLAPAVLWAVRPGASSDEARRVVVSTHTRALQEQLLRKDVPILERALGSAGISFRHAILMGSENYLCVQRLREARALMDEDPRKDRARPFLALERYARTAASGLRSEIPFPVPDRIWSQVRRDRDVCLGPRGPFWDACVYRRDIARSREAHLLIVNHALFLLDLAAGGRILPPHGAVILDESHRLEEVAISQFGISVSDLAVARLARDAEPWGVPRLRPGDAAIPRGAIREANESLRENAGVFFNEVRREAATLAGGAARGRNADPDGGGPPVRVRRPGLVEDRLAAPLRHLEEALQSFAERASSQEDAQVLSGLAARARDLRDRVSLFLTQRIADAVYWIEAPRTTRAPALLRVTPIEVAPILRQRLFEGSRTVVLTSATLSAAGSCAHVRRRLGLTAAREVILGSPFDFARQAILYLPASMPDPGEDPQAWAGAIADECRRLILASDGGAFVLFTSYALLSRTHEALAGDPALRDLPLFRHRPGAATAILEEFRMTRRGVLLGTMSFWQGVDVPGEALRSVIITRLPFEVPDHPLAQARAEVLRERGSDPFTEDALPEAILTLRQGFGRLVRTREDRGVVAVLDPRVKTRAYGAAFLESLPECTRTDSVHDVARFLAAPPAD